MAERRMFAKTIIDSDAFLEMPATTQNLYFHLSMRADDEGFVNNPKAISRVVGTKDDDLKILFSKKFIIGFDSGVIVIKAWKIHNYIQNDRFNETKYKNEKALLELDENKSYTLKTDVSILDTQVRIGKDSIGKDSIGKDSMSSEPTKIENEPLPLQTNEIINKYNEIFNKKISMTGSRKTKIKARIKDFGLGEILRCFEIVKQTPFLMGVNDRKWVADFDWLIGNDTNMAKVLEGKYGNVETVKQSNVIVD